MKRSGDCHFQRLSNLIDHKPHILVHLMIAKANHAISAFQKPRCAARIILRRRILQMLRPIKFNDESLR